MNSLIRNVRVLASLSEKDRADLACFMRARTFEAGTVVCERGETGATMLVVAQGALSLVMPGPDHQAVEVARLGAGDVLGEMSCISPGPRRATVVAATPTTVYELGRRELTIMQRLVPGAAAALVRAVIRDVVARLRRLNQRIERELTWPPALSLRQAELAMSPTDDSALWRALLSRARGSA